MKNLLISIFVLFTTTSFYKTQGQDKDHPKVDVFLNDYQNKRVFNATSEQSQYFAQAFYELLQTIPPYENALKSVEGKLKYVIRQTSIQNPLTRNNGQKIYNGFIFAAFEIVDNKQNAICAFVYDIDSNALYADINNNGRMQKLLYANQDGLNKCAKYCHFNK